MVTTKPLPGPRERGGFPGHPQRHVSLRLRRGAVLQRHGGRQDRSPHLSHHRHVSLSCRHLHLRSRARVERQLLAARLHHPDGAERPAAVHGLALRGGCHVQLVRQKQQGAGAGAVECLAFCRQHRRGPAGVHRGWLWLRVRFHVVLVFVVRWRSCGFLRAPRLAS